MAEAKDRVRGASYELITSARELRRRETPAERILWSELRGRKLDGAKFRRQYAIGSYILDFVCTECRLVVELDGKHHQSDEQREYDRTRAEHLEAHGYRIKRFPNEAVTTDLEGVLEAIKKELRDAAPGR